MEMEQNVRLVKRRGLLLTLAMIGVDKMVKKNMTRPTVKPESSGLMETPAVWKIESVKVMTTLTPHSWLVSIITNM